MDWAVSINDEGIQAQIRAGRNTAKASAEAADMKKHAKIMFVFELADGGHDPDGDYEDRKTFEDFLSVKIQEIADKYGAASVAETHGYNIRKSTLGPYVEVVAQLDDADNYSDFQKNYRGLNGAIKILRSATKLLHPFASSSKDASRIIDKQIRKLEVESET